MAVHIAFLRAVNVAPRWVKMEQLRKLLSDNGFDDVETHIQSGNIRLRTAMRSRAKIVATLERLIEDEFGFPVPVVLRTPDQLSRIAAHADALPDPIDGVQSRYVTFCVETPSSGTARTIGGWEVDGERLMVDGDEIHWWLAKSAHQAKISNARIEKLVGPATTRDLKVVRALAAKWGNPA